MDKLLAVVLACLVSPAASAASLSDEFKELGIKRSGGGPFTYGGQHPKHCGRRGSLFQLQVKVEDVVKATDELIGLLGRYDARNMREPCKMYAEWIGGFNPSDARIHLTLRVKETDLLRFSRDVIALGSPQYVAEVENQGADITAAEVAEFEKLRSKFIRTTEESNRLKELKTYRDVRDDSIGRVAVHVLLVGGELPRVEDEDFMVTDYSLLPSNWIGQFLWRDSVKVENARTLLGLARGAVVPELRGAVGAYLLTKRPIVADVIPGSVAYAAGIRAGDVILEVNGVPTTGVASSEIVRRMRGVPGTRLLLKVERDGKSRDYDLVRLEMLPAGDQIRGLAESCMNTEDQQVASRCLEAFGLQGGYSIGPRTLASVRAMLASRDSDIRIHAFRGLMRVWANSSAPYIPVLPGKAGDVVVMDMGRGLVQKELCGDKPESECAGRRASKGLILRHTHPTVGVATVTFSGPGVSVAANFPCRWNDWPTEVEVGPFYNLSTGTYLQEAVTCAGVKSRTTVVVGSGYWKLDLCTYAREQVRCAHSAAEIDPVELSKSKVDVRMRVKVPQSTRSRGVESELCGRIGWTLGGSCDWDSDGFSRRVILPYDSRFEFDVNRKGGPDDGIDSFEVSARLDRGRAFAETRNQRLAPGGGLRMSVDLPEVDRPYEYASSDHVARLVARSWGLSITTSTLSGKYEYAARRQALRLVSPALYHLKGSQFYLTSAVPLTLTFAATAQARKGKLLRFQDGRWSQDEITRADRNWDGNTKKLVALGYVRRSGVYAVFVPGKDATAPETRLFVQGPSWNDGTVVKLSTAATIALVAGDPVVGEFSSGVATTYFRIDLPQAMYRTEFEVYSSTIPAYLFDRGGTLRYKSIDWAGNTEAEKSVQIAAPFSQMAWPAPPLPQVE